MQCCTQRAVRRETNCKHARCKGLCAKTLSWSCLGISAIYLALWGELTMQAYKRHLTEPCLSPAALVLIHKTPSSEPAAGISPDPSTFPLYSSPCVVSEDHSVSGLYNFISPTKSSPLCPFSLPPWKNIHGNIRKTLFVGELKLQNPPLTYMKDAEGAA